MLCKAGNITKNDIGAIRVQKNVSFIEIRQASVAKFVKAIGPNLRVEDNASLTQLEKPPAAANTPRPSFSERSRDRKDKGPKRKSAKQHAADHNNHTERDKTKKPRRPKSKGIPHSSENWDAELKRLEGAVTALKPKRKNENSNSSGKKEKTAKSPSAKKRGKDFAKKNKT
jgi:ATP-dependent RNA helicase DeaD